MSCPTPITVCMAAFNTSKKQQLLTSHQLLPLMCAPDLCNITILF